MSKREYTHEESLDIITLVGFRELELLEIMGKVFVLTKPTLCLLTATACLQ